MAVPEAAADVFDRVLTASPPVELAAPELLPTRWARAAAVALAVDGAALSLHADEGLRVPLGASDRYTARAEQVQFTYGAGPAMQAHDTGTAIAFDDGALLRNWPGLLESLEATASFSAVFSTPLLPPLGPALVLDLYLHEAEAVHRLDRAEVQEVAVRLSRHAARAMVAAGDEEVGWWRAPDTRRRTRVWEAVGAVAVEMGRDADDALAVLRAHAVATGQLVEDVAEQVLTRRIGVVELDGAPRAE